jgi:hypothetical protein
MEDDEKKCPQCAEMVKTEARICRFCGHNFVDADAPRTTLAAMPNKKGNAVGKGCLIVIGILVVLYLIGSLAGPTDRIPATLDTSIDAAASDAVGSADASGFDMPSVGLIGPQANARRTAEQYLAMTGFSRAGLIDQLSSDAGNGYEVADATAAVDSLSVDWNEQAARSAKQYLQMTGFSCGGLVEQLSSSAGSKYTTSEAKYGAQQAGAC